MFPANGCPQIVQITERTTVESVLNIQILETMGNGDELGRFLSSKLLGNNADSKICFCSKLWAVLSAPLVSGGSLPHFSHELSALNSLLVVRGGGGSDGFFEDLPRSWSKHKLR